METTEETRKKMKSQLREICHNPREVVTFLKEIKHGGVKRYICYGWVKYYIQDSLIHDMMNAQTRWQRKRIFQNLKKEVRHMFYDGLLDYDQRLQVLLAIWVIYKLRNKYNLIYVFL